MKTLQDVIDHFEEIPYEENSVISEIEEIVNVLKKHQEFLQEDITPILRYIKDPKEYKDNFNDGLTDDNWEKWLKGRGQYLFDTKKDLLGI